MRTRGGNRGPSRPLITRFEDRLRPLRPDLLLEVPESMNACMVCGDKTRSCYQHACGDYWCRGVLTATPWHLHPDKNRKARSTKRAKEDKSFAHAARLKNNPLPLKGFDLTEAVEHYAVFWRDSSTWFVDNENIGSDDRGVLLEQEQARNPWNPKNSLAVFLKIIGGNPAIKVFCRYGLSAHASLLRALKTDLIPDGYDYFFVWKCGCAYAHEVRYKKIDGIPQSLGYHDACPVCGCAPIEISKG